MESVGLPSHASVLDQYAESYADPDVHLLMLRDAPRVAAYARALAAARPLLSRASLVLDVGAGTGILALLAAREGGAQRVLAVEQCAPVAALARDVVTHNGLEGVVEVCCARVEELPTRAAGGPAADALVSEWMGFYLLHESMLDSVLWARDNLLRPGGAMFPCRAVLYIAPVALDALFRERVEPWAEPVCGFDFSAFTAPAFARLLAEPQVRRVAPEDILAEPAVAADLDLTTLDPQDLALLAADFDFTVTRRGSLGGIACWFDVRFPPAPGGGAADSVIVLDTSPHAPPTHWQQVVVVLPEMRAVEPGDTVVGRFSIARKAPPETRRFTISVEIEPPPGATTAGIAAVMDGHPVDCECAQCVVLRACLQQQQEQQQLFASAAECRPA